MALFEFNDGSSAISGTGPSASVSVTDDGVNFTISTTANPGTGNQNAITYNPHILGDGQFTISDYGGGVAPWVLDITNGTTQNDFDGDGLQLQIGNTLTGTWNVTFVATSGPGGNVVVPVTATGQIISPGSTAHFESIQFTPASSSSAISVDSLNVTIVCYLEGTGIDTPEGQIKVEDLQPGDVVQTADGGTTTVQWVGQQPVETRLTHPARVNPIRIAAGAIADNVPARDLYVSPDHAIEIDGLLVNASALVNGRSITMVPKMPLEGFNYYHVETEAHEVILAEGCPAESYLDMPDRASFVKGAERAHVPAIAEMDLPRLTARRMLPEALIARLEERADRMDARKKRAA